VTTAAASWNRSVTLSWMGLNKHLHEPSGTRIQALIKPRIKPKDQADAATTNR